ncbi:MAG: phosphatidylserine/phosphatidylglycerophosphate/cardiolipin synthase family protein [Desulfobacterales bacterium]|nr:MAG: phosphatidylserine/phosphatidylglycerophosphate/cardiolipin synthase family protein [Desulfobacterales bacterium]
MRVPKPLFLLLWSLLLAVLVAAFWFIFNPMGLGPEPARVLEPAFFAIPAERLSGLELLVDGPEAFAKIVETVDAAESSILVQTYIWKDDRTGMEVAERLKAAARRGVKVTIRKDLLGTFFELDDMLKGRPSPVFTKSGLRGYANIDVDLDVWADTDHSKYFIVDGRLVIFGGMNIADEYHRLWHDYMVVLRGQRWTEAFAAKVLEGTPWPQPSPLVLAVNDERATEIRTALIEMVDNARDRVVLEHAYFSDLKVIKALERAAAKGVKVDLILPRQPDTHVYANLVTINRLLRSGPAGSVDIYLYPQMSHAKVVLTDGVIAAVGSANLTPRSMLTSREVTLFVHAARNDPFIRRLRDQLEANIAASAKVVAPFKLTMAEQIMAWVGKWVW